MQRPEETLGTLQREQEHEARLSVNVALQLLIVERTTWEMCASQAFREANKSVCLHVAADGVEAMAFLERRGEHVDAPRPDLIPKMDGGRHSLGSRATRA